MLARVELAPEPMRRRRRRCRCWSCIRSRSRRLPASRRWRWKAPAGSRQRRSMALAIAADAGRRGRSERSGDLAQRVAQRAVPVRLGQEVQALPRKIGLGVRLSSERVLPDPINAKRDAGRAGRWCVAVLTVMTVLALDKLPAGVPTCRRCSFFRSRLSATSGEVPSGLTDHKERLVAATRYLSDQLAAQRLYAVLDPAPIGPDIAKAQAMQSLDKCTARIASPGWCMRIEC